MYSSRRERERRSATEIMFANSSTSRTNNNKKERSSLHLFYLAALSAIIVYSYNSVLEPLMFGDLIDELNEFDYHQKQHMAEELQRRLSTDDKLATIERVLAVAKDTFPECMGQGTWTALNGETYGNNNKEKMSAVACKNFIDEFILSAVDAEGVQMFSNEDKFVRTRILGERKKQDFWYNTIVLQMDENDKIKGRDNDGIVYFDWTWDGSGTAADHEAQSAIPVINAIETDAGAAEAANTQTQYVQASATSAPEQTQTGSTTAAAAATTGTEATQSSGTTTAATATTAAATTAATAAPTQGTEASQASSSTAASQASSSTAAPEASTTDATTTDSTTTSATTTTTTSTSEATTTDATTTIAATEAAVTDATAAGPDATAAGPDTTTTDATTAGVVAVAAGGASSNIVSSVETTTTTTTTTTTIAPVAYVEEPVIVMEEGLLVEGATTEGAKNGTDHRPIAGGVVTSVDAVSGPTGTAKLVAALSEPVAIPNAGKHDIGPWDCSDMVAYDCCLMIKWLHQDSDVNGLAIQCFFEYKEGTGKANYMFEKSSKKVHIKMDKNGYTKKTPKVIGSWGNLATNGDGHAAIEEYKTKKEAKSRKL